MTDIGFSPPEYLNYCCPDVKKMLTNITENASELHDLPKKIEMECNAFTILPDFRQSFLTFQVDFLTGKDSVETVEPPQSA